MLTLRQPLTLAECQIVREWRNDPAVLPMLRTGYKTEEQQAAFYRDVICNPDSKHQYYALEMTQRFIGMGGLTYLDWDKKQGEISLIIGPEFRDKGVGTAAVDALLEQAKTIGLESVIGECYAQGHQSFWMKQIAKRPALLRWEWTL